MRGKAEFNTMKPVTLESEKKISVPKDEDPQINKRSPKLPGDPMRNIMGSIEDNISRKGFAKIVINEALASIKK